MQHPSPLRTASVLLFAMAVVAAAGLVAYAFTMSMRAHGTVSKDLLVAGLAESAARSGVRHAAEVVLRDYLTNPSGVTKPYGPHVTHFMDTRQKEGTWAANPSGGLAHHFSTHPGNDGIDNLQVESRLWLMQLDTQDQGLSVYGLSAQYGALSPYTTTAVTTGTGRYIEPGRYNSDGTPVRFSDSAATPDINVPIWYGADWKPVNSRDKARYRLRYALTAMDLGGHPVWGRQVPYRAPAAAVPGAEPTEWDLEVAKRYNAPFYNAVCATVQETDENPPQYSFQSVFLGWGSTVANPDAAKRTSAGYLLPGFSPANGRPVAYSDMPGALVNGPIGLAGLLSASGVGGPASWSTAERLVSSGASSIAAWTLTPFGRAGVYNPTPSKYYHARVSTPWRINALTAPAESIKMMLWAYLPPQITRNYTSTRTEKGWTGYVAPPWPAVPYPTWDGATTTVAVPGPTPAWGPGRQIQSSLFSPAELAASPFASFSSPDYLAPVNANTYNAAYPDTPDNWEDYAYLEMNPTVRDSVSAGDATEHSKRMLGWHNNLYSETSHTVPAVAGEGPGVSGNPGWVNRGTSNALPMEPTRGLTGSILTSRRQSTVIADLNAPKVTIDLSGGTTDIRHFYHRNSYWLDMAGATAIAVTVAKSQHFDSSSIGDFFDSRLDGASGVALQNLTLAGVPAAFIQAKTATVPGFDPRLLPCLPTTITINGVAGLGKGPDHVRDLDRLFLAALGEYFFDGDEALATSLAQPKFGIYNIRQGYAVGSAQELAIRANLDTSAGAVGYDKDQLARWGRNIIRRLQVSANIRGMRQLLTTLAVPAANIDRKLANMELVLNDWRMSFFGANPTYADFRPIDFDGDGNACASCYTGSATISGKSIPSRPAVNGRGPVPDRLFSLSGYFVMEKARYWRIIARGEVFDEILRKPIHEANLETVFAIDPEGQALSNPAISPDTTTLYSRWITNYYRGNAPQSY